MTGELTDDVAVAGTFNGWSKEPLTDEHNRLWSVDVPAARPGDDYRYVIVHDGVELRPWRPDPYATAMRSSLGDSAAEFPGGFSWGYNPSSIFTV
ncbi:hypothetical protein ACFOWZ_40100 [Lentzea rhizosphaerae]|uniref:Glycoside hydrolase family 13 N-terminal domain-containing protein n=1 Tax=Lentzea rhizosphaerae TaxID=2041025 RepID=A0ABV8C720_9PSEU